MRAIIVDDPVSGRGFFSRLFRRQPKAERESSAAARRGRRRRKDREVSPAALSPSETTQVAGDESTEEPWYRQSGPLFDESFTDGTSPDAGAGESRREQAFDPPVAPGGETHLPQHVPMIQRIEDVAESTPLTGFPSDSEQEQAAAPQVEFNPFAPPSRDDGNDVESVGEVGASAPETDDDAAEIELDEPLPTTSSSEDSVQHELPMVVPVRGYYLTRSDDTLRSVAAQFLNAPERWSELRAINAAQPGIADVDPDELLEPHTALALPGDPLPWGRPDPVHLWTLAETLLYSAWGREPTPEEVVPFWRGLTRGALPEGEQPPSASELPGVAEIEAHRAPTPSPEAEGTAEPLLPPPFEMPAAAVDEPSADDAPSVEARAPALVGDEVGEMIEPLEDVEIEDAEQLVAEGAAEEQPTAEAERDGADETSPAESVISDAAAEVDDLLEIDDEAESSAPIAPVRDDSFEDAAEPDTEAGSDLSEAFDAAVTTDPTFDLAPADSIEGAEQLEELVEAVEYLIEAAIDEESPGVDDAEGEIVLEEGVVASRIDDDDIVDATIIEDTTSDDDSDGPEPVDDLLATEEPAQTDVLEDDQLADETHAPHVPDPEPALEPTIPPSSVQPPPVAPPAPPVDPAYGVETPSLEPPPTFEDWLGESDATSPGADPSAPYAGLPAAGSARAPAMPPEAEAPRVPHFLPSVTGSVASDQPPVARSTPMGRSLAGTAVGDAMMLWQLARRRRHSQRGAGAADAIEQALQQTAGSESLQLIETAMRHLYAVTVGQQRAAPSVLAVRVGTYGFEVLLDKPIETPPGWRSASGGFVLELPQGVTAHDLSAIGQGPSLCPALVPVGNTYEGPLLLNLEQLGCLAISGPSSPAASLLGAIVSALGSSPMASDLRITGVGLDNAAGMIGWEAVRFTGYDAPELEALLASAHGPGDGAIELLVVGPGNDLLIQRAGQVATAPGSRLSLVGATSAVSARWPWRIHVDDTGTAVVHPISITMTAARALPPEALAELGGVAPGGAGPAGLR